MRGVVGDGRWGMEDEAAVEAVAARGRLCMEDTQAYAAEWVCDHDVGGCDGGSKHGPVADLEFEHGGG